MADDDKILGNAMLFKHLIGNNQNVIEILTDAEQLKNCLTEIGFKVSQYEDLKPNQIRDAVKMQVIAENSMRHSSQALFVGFLGAATTNLSNNEQGHLNIWEDIVLRFGPKYCSGLKRKSKLFFVDTHLNEEDSKKDADLDDMLLICSERNTISSRSSRTARLRRRTCNYENSTPNQSSLSKGFQLDENYHGSKVVKLLCEILRNYPEKSLSNLFSSWNSDCEKLDINASIICGTARPYSSSNSTEPIESGSTTNLAELQNVVNEIVTVKSHATAEEAEIPQHAVRSIIMVDKCVGAVVNVTDATTMTDHVESETATAACSDNTDVDINEAEFSDGSGTSGLKRIFNSLKVYPKKSSIKRYNSLNDAELLRSIKSVSWQQQLSDFNAISEARKSEHPKITNPDLQLSVDNGNQEISDSSCDSDSSTDSMILHSPNSSNESAREDDDETRKECELRESEVESRNDPMEVIKPENEVTILPDSIQVCGVDSCYRLNVAVCAPFGPWTWKSEYLPIKLYLRHKSEESNTWEKIDVHLQHPKKHIAWQAAICSVEATKLLYWISYRDSENEEEHLVLSTLPDGRRIVSQRLMWQARREGIHVDCDDGVVWVLPELVCTPVQRFTYPGLQHQKEWTYEKILSPAQLSTSADKMAILDNADQCIYVFNKQDFQLFQIVKYHHVVSSTALVLIPTAGPGAPDAECLGGLKRQPMLLALNRDRLNVWNRLGENLYDTDFLPTALKDADPMLTILHQSCGSRRYVMESIPGNEVITSVYPLEQLLKRIDSSIRNHKQKINQINADSGCVFRSFKYEDLLESAF